TENLVASPEVHQPPANSPRKSRQTTPFVSFPRRRTLQTHVMQNQPKRSFSSTGTTPSSRPLSSSSVGTCRDRSRRNQGNQTRQLELRLQQQQQQQRQQRQQRQQQQQTTRPKQQRITTSQNYSARTRGHYFPIVKSTVNKRNITHPEGSFASASTMGSLPQKVVFRFMRRILSKDSSRKVATVEESEGCQKVEVGVHTKEEREKKEEEEEEKKKKEKKKEEEEDLSEWWFPDGELTPEQSSLLKDWQSALFQYLTTASRLSSQVVIVTNSRRPWVETCVSTFAPSCKKLFAGSTGGAKGGIKVVYALEVLQDMRSKRKLASNGWEGSFPVKCTMPLSDLEVTEELTWAKFHAMHREAKAFYRRYKGQSWKNIISLGD
ncbi:unnamed protein product, partial [Polarella glacialis]